MKLRGFRGGVGGIKGNKEREYAHKWVIKKNFLGFLNESELSCQPYHTLTLLFLLERVQ